MSSHPVQLSLEPALAETCMLHGIKSVTSKSKWAICCGPARQILAPESGNMLVLTDWVFLCLGRHDGKMTGMSCMLL